METFQVMNRIINSVEKIERLDKLQKEVLEKLYSIINGDRLIICNAFKDYFKRYKVENTKNKKSNKGGPLDNWFERCLYNNLKRNRGNFDFKYEDFNEFVVPDIVEICGDYVLCLDGKTNSNDGDGKKNKVHFGVNQSNMGLYSFKNYVSGKNPELKGGPFRGDIKPYYNEKPTLCYIAKIVYDDKQLEPECKSIHIYCIPHRDTIHLYENKIKRGGNKSPDEQRLEINDNSLIRVINLN